MEILLTVLRYAWPYVLAASVGFGAAWSLQGLRIEALKLDVEAEAQKLTDYKVDQELARLDAERAAENRRKETADEWRKKLEIQARDHDAYKRCVAAGKCGGLRPVSCSPGIRVPPAGGADATGPDAVPPAGESAPEVISDCARTTLMLNQLQDDIDKQIRK